MGLHAYMHSVGVCYSLNRKHNVGQIHHQSYMVQFRIELLAHILHTLTHCRATSRKRPTNGIRY